MTAIALLRQEHRDIERVLDRTEQAIEAARSGSRVHAVLFDRAAEFLRKYVESNHHLKEHVLLVILHRLHTLLEERELLPVAQRLLGPEAMARLWAKFARIEGRAGSVAEAAAALEVAFGTEVRR